MAPTDEPADENISQKPPSELDRDEGDFNPGATGDVAERRKDEAAPEDKKRKEESRRTAEE